MLPTIVECPRCHKQGFLSLRPVKSSHYCQIKIPYDNPKYIKKEIINPIAEKGQERIKLVDRWRVTYGPFWHLYIGHYDSQKYKKGMDDYKEGKLRYRPNGRRWCKVRYNKANGQRQSDLEILMAKYNFTLRDLRNEERERKTDFLLKTGHIMIPLCKSPLYFDEQDFFNENISNVH